MLKVIALTAVSNGNNSTDVKTRSEAHNLGSLLRDTVRYAV